MTEKLTLIEFDVASKTETVRELSSEELQERQRISDQFTAQELEQEAKAEARTSALAKLAALGLTEEEIAAL
jgi:hypothetical protein